MASLWRMRSRRISRPDSLSFSVVFVLLVLALLAIRVATDRPFYFADGLRPQLPTVTVTVPLRQAERDDAIQIVVMSDGYVFLGSERVIPDQMTEKIAILLKNGAEPKAYLKVDQQASYAVVKEVLASVRAAGIQSVAFLADQPKGGQ